MLEFFERDKSEFEDAENIREIYPIVDSLTGGQLAGLDFNHAAVAEIEFFSDNVHFFYCFRLLYRSPGDRPQDP